MRIELTYQAWEARVLPLNYARIHTAAPSLVPAWEGFCPPGRNCQTKRRRTCSRGKDSARPSSRWDPSLPGHSAVPTIGKGAHLFTPYRSSIIARFSPLGDSPVYSPTLGKRRGGRLGKRPCRVRPSHEGTGTPCPAFRTSCRKRATSGKPIGREKLLVISCWLGR